MMIKIQLLLLARLLRRKKFFILDTIKTHLMFNLLAHMLIKLGHYQSLEAIGGKTPNCCKTSSSSVSISSVNNSSTPSNGTNSVSQKNLNEEKILNLLKNEKDVVGSCLDRLKDMKPISYDELFKTQICQILFREIRPLYPATSMQGKKCRKLLKFYQNLC